VGDDDTGSPGRQVSSGLQVPGEPGHCRARTRNTFWSSCGFFPSELPSIAPAEINNTPRWQFGTLEDNQWGRRNLDPKKSRRENFQEFFTLGLFCGEVSRYGATPLIIALSPGHSDITRFHPCSKIAPDRKSFGSRQSIPNVAQTTGNVDVFDPRSGISGPT